MPETKTRSAILDRIDQLLNAPLETSSPKEEATMPSAPVHEPGKIHIQPAAQTKNLDELQKKVELFQSVFKGEIIP